MQSLTGLDEFKQLLSEYKSLSVWAAGASIVIPFVASFLAVIPPWPDGLDIITAIIQLGALVVAYQTFRNSAKVVTKSVKRWAAIGLTALLCYLIIFSMFTVYDPGTSHSYIIGFQCLPDARQLSELRKLAGVCPFLQYQDLRTVGYDPSLLWTKTSITAIRVSLIAVWFTLFICLAFLIGHFLVFQMRRKLRGTSSSAGPSAPLAGIGPK
jgi:hypothetical protein